MTCFYPPLRGLAIRLRERWRNRHACHHEARLPLREVVTVDDDRLTEALDKIRRRHARAISADRRTTIVGSADDAQQRIIYEDAHHLLAALDRALELTDPLRVRRAVAAELFGGRSRYQPGRPA